MQHQEEYDFVMINDDLEKCVGKILKQIDLYKIILSNKFTILI